MIIAPAPGPVFHALRLAVAGLVASYQRARGKQPRQRRDDGRAGSG
jgi:hypothetical protein